MFRNLSIILCTLGLSGCISATRPCPGFGTALADQWSTALNVGDVVTYVSNTGSTVKLEMSAREDSEPYEGRSSNGSDKVTCNSYSDRLYSIENSDVAMRVLLEQDQFEDPSLEAAQRFYIEIKPESLEGERAPGYRYGISLGLDARQQYSDTFGPENDPSADIVARRFVENLQVGNNIYTYSIELKYSNVTPLSNAVTNSNSFAGITRMILAEDAGLVQFELLNGEIYSRL